MSPDPGEQILRTVKDVEVADKLAIPAASGKNPLAGD
jgi:hypothetical protein